MKKIIILILLITLSLTTQAIVLQKDVPNRNLNIQPPDDGGDWLDQGNVWWNKKTSEFAKKPKYEDSNKQDLPPLKCPPPMTKDVKICLQIQQVKDGCVSSGNYENCVYRRTGIETEIYSDRTCGAFLLAYEGQKILCRTK